jgi:hypothetical protein
MERGSKEMVLKYTEKPKAGKMRFFSWSVGVA